MRGNRISILQVEHSRARKRVEVAVSRKHGKRDEQITEYFAVTDASLDRIQHMMNMHSDDVCVTLSETAVLVSLVPIPDARIYLSKQESVT